MLGRYFWAALIVLALANSARADWQNTRWGMTPQQVMKATGGATIQNASGLEMPYTTGPYRFRAQFIFDGSGRLEMVDLHLENLEMAFQLMGDMKAKYGKPVEDGSDRVMYGYKWLTSSDLIVLAIVGKTTATLATIKYRARIRPGSKGL